MKRFFSALWFIPQLSLACMTNNDCEIGSVCVMFDPIEIRYGACVGGPDPGNANDKTPKPADKNIFNENYGNTCRNDTECIPLFCYKQKSDFDGLCLNGNYLKGMNE